VEVTLATGAPKGLAEKSVSSQRPGREVRLIVRTAYKQAKADGEPPPYRIVRCGGEMTAAARWCKA